MNLKHILILFLIFIVGFFFRLWFISYSPQPIVYDQMEYHTYAVEWMQKGMTAAWFRTYAYPLFLMLIYKLAGIGNFPAVFTVQALLDTATGFLLFFLANGLFKKKNIAWIVLVLYTFNPYTSGYVGVLLTEVLAGFLVALFLLFLTKSLRLLREPRSLKWGLFFVTGMMLGYLVQVRPAFLVWSIFTIVAMGLLVSFKDEKKESEGKRRIRPWTTIFFVVGYCIPFAYTMYTNSKFFNQFSPTTVVGFSQELYSGTFIKDFPAFMDSADDYSPQLPAMYGKLFSAIDTPQKRKETQTYFREKAIENIVKDPIDYGVWRIKKMGRMWDREKLFFYHETNHEKYWYMSLWVHRVLLLFAAIGIVQGIWWNRGERGNSIKKDNLVQLFSFYCVGTIGLFTLLFSLTHAESRLTIPLMPIVFLYAGVGLYCVFRYPHEKTS